MTAIYSDAQIDDIKRRTDIVKVAGELGAVLRLSGGKHKGSCPMCGGGKSATRFEIVDTGWVCAVCPAGGDVIELVRRATGCSFAQAVDRLGGTRVLSPDEERQLEQDRKDHALKEDQKKETYRLKELNAAMRIWNRGHVPGYNGVVMRYLASRGLALPKSAIIREHDELGYYHGTTAGANGETLPRAIHHGPAMVAALVGNDGAQRGVHITFLLKDGSGKVKLADPETGEMLPAKKMRGSKAGCHIVLRQGVVIHRLFIAEGIETCLSVATALHKAGKLLAGDAFWAAGDLGNLGGPHAKTVLHSSLLTASGRPQRIPGPEPADDGRAIAIPDSVHTLVLLGDGDSEPELTAHTMERAKRRYHKPGRAIAVVPAPKGVDFNDIIQGKWVPAPVLQELEPA